MTRTIQYLPKQTAAKTEYREISEADQSWLLGQLMEYMVVMATLTTNKSEDAQILIDKYWRQTDKELPRGRDGLNTPESLVAGILDNMLYAEARQKDFTAKQCAALENISIWLQALDSARFTDITFQVRTF